MIGALLLAMLVAHRRRLIDIAVLGGFVVMTVLVLAYLPFAAACGVWALLLIPAIVHATTHDVEEDE